MNSRTCCFRTLSIVVYIVIAAASCDMSRKPSVKQYEYPTGELKLLEEYHGSDLRKSTWYDTNGKVLRTTDWTATGDGMMYGVEDSGWISFEAPVKSRFAHGTAKYFDVEGRVVATQEFRDGVAMSDKIPVEAGEETATREHE